VLAGTYRGDAVVHGLGEGGEREALDGVVRRGAGGLRALAVRLHVAVGLHVGRRRRAGRLRVGAGGRRRIGLLGLLGLLFLGRLLGRRLLGQRLLGRRLLGGLPTGHLRARASITVSHCRL